MQDKRKQVDELDRVIMEQLQHRFQLSRQIIREKIEQGLPLYDPTREAEILLRAEAHGEVVKELYKRLLELSKQDGVEDGCRTNNY